jgi:hypothetical protein
MSKDDVLFGYRQQLFAEAARTNAAAACPRFEPWFRHSESAR